MKRWGLTMTLQIVGQPDRRAMMTLQTHGDLDDSRAGFAAMEDAMLRLMMLGVQAGEKYTIVTEVHPIVN